MSDYPGRIISRLAEHLEGQEMSTAELARCLSTSWGQANRLAQGEIPGPETLRRLCFVFTCQPGDILRYERK